MADLTVTEATQVKIIEQFTGPAGEPFALGEAVRLDTSTGEITPANGSTAAEARVLGIVVKEATAANDTVTVAVKGYVDLGDALDALTYDDDVFLSNTDGTLADTAGTVSTIVGTVVPGYGATTPDKLLRLDL